jgi:hypothetical protein
MAAPALAGAAAIVRQYFEEGYCNSNGKCCGQRGCGSYMKPSGALLKAVLMNGAQPLKGGVQYVPAGKILKDQPLRAYDSNQGMGRVNLLNSVPLRGQNTMYMMVVNDKNLVNGRKDVYTVYADKSNGCNRPLSVTLAWYGECYVLLRTTDRMYLLSPRCLICFDSHYRLSWSHRLHSMRVQ